MELNKCKICGIDLDNHFHLDPITGKIIEAKKYDENSEEYKDSVEFDCYD